MELTKITAGNIYFDTNIFIYALEDVEEYKVQINALFLHIQNLGCLIITSDLTLAECLVKPLQNKDESSVSRYESSIKNTNDMSVLAVSKTILKAAAQNKADYKNKLPDAIHLATALESGCKAFVTNDTNLKVPNNIIKLILKELKIS